MAKPLTESQREEMLAQVTEVHNVVSGLISNLPQPLLSQIACPEGHRVVLNWYEELRDREQD